MVPPPEFVRNAPIIQVVSGMTAVVIPGRQARSVDARPKLRHYRRHGVAACYKLEAIIDVNDFLKSLDSVKNCLISPAVFNSGLISTVRRYLVIFDS